MKPSRLAGPVPTILLALALPAGAEQVAVTVPDLSAKGQAGAVAYYKFCASCHGQNGGGSEKGPPLIHKIYEPGHHADFAFFRAAREGARQHHWRFGDMKPVQGISDQELHDIVAYVREVQRANGIE